MTSGSRKRRYNWWNREPLRTLDEERAVVAIQLTAEDRGDRRKRTRKSSASKGTKRRACAARTKR